MKIFHFFILFPILLLVFSCEIINPEEEIPSYISIDSTILKTTLAEGPNTKNITDAWIYVDDQPIGCFELPCRVPVLKTGRVKLDIRAGIKINGIGALRSAYPFLVPNISEMELKAGEISKINPEFTYNSNYKFEINEQFDFSGTIFSKTQKSDTIIAITSVNAIPQNNGSYGQIFIDANRNTFEIATNVEKILPKTGVPIFVEMDYKCDHPFTFGVFINYANYRLQHGILNINATSEWKKIYINLTEISTREINAESYDLFLGSELQEGSESANFQFDNIRLIY